MHVYTPSANPLAVERRGPRWPALAFRPGPRARAASLALGAVLLWATWPALASVAQPLPPFLVLGLAALVGWLFAGGRATLRGEGREFFRVPPRTLALVAGGLLVNNALYLMAMPRIGPAEANVIAYLWPVMLVALGALARREPLRRHQLAGLGVAFCGAAVVIGPRFALGFDGLGLALAFGSGLSFALYALIRSFGRERGDVIGPGLGLLGALALALHVAFEPAALPEPRQWAAILGIGLAPLGLSNMLWDRASRSGELALVSTIAYATPLAALVLLALSGTAAVSWTTAAGAVPIVVGACLAAGAARPGRR